MNRFCCVAIGILFPLAVPGAPGGEAPKQLTILYDAFGKSPKLKKDWGFAALIHYGGKRVLFDTGNDADVFAHNLKQLKVDVTSLDFVVISHRHGDHTNGLLHLLKARPDVPVYVPADESFGGPTPRGWFERGEESLPKHMRYFDGKPPKNVPHGTAWRNAKKMVHVKETKELVKGMHLLATVSQAKGPAGWGTLGMPELSLAVQTPKGLVVLTGCAHCGVEKVVEKAAGLDKHIHLVAGGFHLVTSPEADIEQVAANLRERWKVHSVAPGHCTGERGFLTLRKVFGKRYVYAGVGEVIPLP
jgi:7,8-dihydropterin-6-yl-methyl-4-(beta-D-ribofuranosyl)aminobenzene 5'-phosphate synthase